MAWRKSPPELIAAFAAALPADRRVQRRSMFGYPCAFARGNMFTGLHQERLIVRLPDHERAHLLAHPGAAIFEPMAGRQMKEYVAVPAEIVEDADELRGWMMRALDYAAALPAKSPKGVAKAAPRAATRRGAAKASVTKGPAAKASVTKGPAAKASVTRAPRKKSPPTKAAPRARTSTSARARTR